MAVRRKSTNGRRKLLITQQAERNGGRQQNSRVLRAYIADPGGRRQNGAEYGVTQERPRCRAQNRCRTIAKVYSR